MPLIVVFVASLRGGRYRNRGAIGFFPWRCNFGDPDVSPNMCGFVQDAANGFDWKVQSGPLDSSPETGPSGSTLSTQGDQTATREKLKAAVLSVSCIVVLRRVLPLLELPAQERVEHQPPHLSSLPQPRAVLPLLPVELRQDAGQHQRLLRGGERRGQTLLDGKHGNSESGSGSPAE